MFEFLSKNKAPKTQHRLFRCKKNGKKYLIVADDVEDAVNVVNEIYPKYSLTAADITEETTDIELIKFYGNEKKWCYESSQ